MKNFLKLIVSKLPNTLQYYLRLVHCHQLLATDRFSPDEPEVELLSRWLSAGSWAIDIGANVGHYTHAMSIMVGSTGRVLAFEPISSTFSILASNLYFFSTKNVSIFNIAISKTTSVANMVIPKLDTGLSNYYMARLEADTAMREHQVTETVLCAPFPIHLANRQIDLVKIDAEGQEANVLEGIREIVERDAPTMIIEDSKFDEPDWLRSLNYQVTKLQGSPNIIYEKPHTLV